MTHLPDLGRGRGGHNESGGGKVSHSFIHFVSRVTGAYGDGVISFTFRFSYSKWGMELLILSPQVL